MQSVDKLNQGVVHLLGKEGFNFLPKKTLKRKKQRLMSSSHRHHHHHFDPPPYVPCTFRIAFDKLDLRNVKKLSIKKLHSLQFCITFLKPPFLIHQTVFQRLAICSSHTFYGPAKRVVSSGCCDNVRKLNKNRLLSVICWRQNKINFYLLKVARQWRQAVHPYWNLIIRRETYSDFLG